MTLLSETNISCIKQILHGWMSKGMVEWRYRRMISQCTWLGHEHCHGWELKVNEDCLLHVFIVKQAQQKCAEDCLLFLPSFIPSLKLIWVCFQLNSRSFGSNFVVWGHMQRLIPLRPNISIALASKSKEKGKRKKDLMAFYDIISQSKRGKRKSNF